MEHYEHRTQYYETDQMGIINHANYIHWFEEARTYMLEELGIGYDKMEESGIISPVLSVYCDYRSMTRFGETVIIVPRITWYTGLKMTVTYEVKDKKTGQIRCLGESKHCFLNKEMKPYPLKKFAPQIHQRLEGFASINSLETRQK